MAEAKFNSPLKIGLLTVVTAYFLFTLHAVLTLEWIGEWDRIGLAFRDQIYVEDVTSFVGMIIRLAAAAIALAAVVYYLVKKGIPKQTTLKVTRVIIILEAAYWLSILSSAIYAIQNLASATRGLSFATTEFALISLASTSTLIIEAIIIPIALLILAYNLSSSKPQKGIIKWSLISGTLYILLFWISNTSDWQYAIRQKGIIYLTAHPENMLNFVLTTVGLLVLALYSAYFTVKSSKLDSVDNLSMRAAGAIILALGLYFLWNYLSWIYFGGDTVWSAWYAWFLGHNLDLWLLSLPFIGVHLLFYGKAAKTFSTKVLLVLEAMGAIFVGFYLVAYLIGIPGTKVYHSELPFRIPLATLGALILITTLIALVLALRSKKTVMSTK
jgi:hypothetical protein